MFFFKIALAILDPWSVCMAFRNSLSCEKCSYNFFLGIVLNLFCEVLPSEEV